MIKQDKRLKIVLIGAGSAVFSQGLIADFIQSEFRQLTISLCDINEEILTAITKLAKRMVSQKQADIIIESSTDRTDVLPGADVIVTTIAVGKRPAWESDVKVPRKYGVYQPVGDSVMPGGISRAMRMIPEMCAIAEDIKKYCPAALFINYSNPMTSIVTAVRRKTGVNLVGLCHGVISGEKNLAKILDGSMEDITTIGVGLNHLTFFYDIRLKGVSQMQRLVGMAQVQKDEALKTGKVHYNFMQEWMHPEVDFSQIPFYFRDPLSWDLLERVGGVPAVLDRHAVEFFPERFQNGDFYGHKLGVDAFSIDEVLQSGDETYAKMICNQDKEDEVAPELFGRADGEHEQLVEILDSFYNDKRKIFSVNVPNNGAVPGLPDDAVLELPAVVGARGFMPIVVPHFPSELRAIIARKLAPAELTVEAALTGDRNKFVEALLLDGAVTDYNTAKKLCDDLIEVQRPFLPQF